VLVRFFNHIAVDADKFVQGKSFKKP
jgi:hypothetical protein